MKAARATTPRRFWCPSRTTGRVVLVKKISEDRALQEGRHSHAERPLRAGDWTANIDLKHAYIMTPTAQKDRDFLKFQRKDKTYHFNCLHSGCSPAFTKTTRPVVVIMQEVGLCLHRHRHYGRGGDRVSPERPHHSSGVPAGESGVCNKPPPLGK